MEGWLGKRPSLQKDYGAWTNHESSGTISFELMRLRWRFGLRAQHYVCLPKTKRSTSPQKPHTNCQAWWLVGGNVLTIHHWKHLLEISSIRITAVYLQSFFPSLYIVTLMMICKCIHIWSRWDAGYSSQTVAGGETGRAEDWRSAAAQTSNIPLLTLYCFTRHVIPRILKESPWCSCLGGRVLPL